MNKETEVSLNAECKELIKRFVKVHEMYAQEVWVEHLSRLVEKCIYLDNHAKDNLEHGTNE